MPHQAIPTQQIDDCSTNDLYNSSIIHSISTFSLPCARQSTPPYSAAAKSFVTNCLQQNLVPLIMYRNTRCPFLLNKLNVDNHIYIFPTHSKIQLFLVSLWEFHLYMYSCSFLFGIVILYWYTHSFVYTCLPICSNCVEKDDLLIFDFVWDNHVSLVLCTTQCFTNFNTVNSACITLWHSCIFFS